ncbi:hypothetical protein [Rhizobium sp. ERR 1071]|uniref:hypothetical protein n=1 Tax=Rhizobium sp. ERR 1071 TaxID=2572677 RepID=UPI0011A8C27C|nr:hypothetical protein [Rhizobium sp. ERR1071]
MAPFQSPPTIKLSRLRDIGWSLWDPIGLLKPGQRWEDEECRSFADEYDTYLLNAAEQLRRGVATSTVIAYLVDIEANYMGLGQRPDTHERANSLVGAINADSLL